jgi:hypothetical protein
MSGLCCLITKKTLGLGLVVFVIAQLFVAQFDIACAIIMPIVC